MLFIVAYDIADPRRLRRVARFLERHATRCQKSVFLYRGERSDLVELLNGLEELLQLTEDAVQAWPLAARPIHAEFVRGTPLPVQPAGIVLADRQRLFVESRSVLAPSSELPNEENLS